MRRQFSPVQEDLDWLEALGLRYETLAEGGSLRIVIYGFRVPPGYNVDVVDVYVRVEAGYPDSQLDMAYFFPPLARADGKPIGAVSPDHFDGKTWQRWSRHRTPANPWRPGIDNLSTHFELISNWLERELLK